MVDFNVKTQLNESEINGLYQQIEDLKQERMKLKERMDADTEKIISHILKHGKVIAYKNDVPHVLSVSNKPSKKFDKSQLAEDLGVTSSELDIVGIAELIEEKRLSSQTLAKYWYEEPDQKLKARKAKKSDMELIYG